MNIYTFNLKSFLLYKSIFWFQNSDDGSLTVCLLQTKWGKIPCSIPWDTVSCVLPCQGQPPAAEYQSWFPYNNSLWLVKLISTYNSSHYPCNMPSVHCLSPSAIISKMEILSFYSDVLFGKWGCRILGSLGGFLLPLWFSLMPSYCFWKL